MGKLGRELMRKTEMESREENGGMNLKNIGDKEVDK